MPPRKLYITINLDGVVSGKVEYNFQKNTNPSSSNNPSIYIPRKYILTKKFLIEKGFKNL